MHKSNHPKETNTAGRTYTHSRQNNQPQILLRRRQEKIKCLHKNPVLLHQIWSRHVSQSPFAVISRGSRDQRTISCQPRWTENHSLCCWRLNEHLATSTESLKIRETAECHPDDTRERRNPCWSVPGGPDSTAGCGAPASSPSRTARFFHLGVHPCPCLRSPAAQGVLSSPLNRPGWENPASNPESGGDPPKHKALASAHAEFQASEEEKNRGNYPFIIVISITRQGF